MTSSSSPAASLEPAPCTVSENGLLGYCQGHFPHASEDDDFLDDRPEPMTSDQTLYLRDGDSFVGTRCTRGSWHANGQSGGAVLALLGHLLEDVPTLTAMSLTRLTVDLVRPVPVDERLQVRAEVLRAGKRIQLVELTVRSGDAELVRARALRVRDRDLTALAGLPPEESDEVVPPVPGPEAAESVELQPGAADFLRFGAEFRTTAAEAGRAATVWVRLRVPVVEDEAVRLTSRAALPMDCVNLIGIAPGDLAAVTAINPDVSAHVLRMPTGEWTGMTGHTRFFHGTGHGVSTATLQDEHGRYGVASTSQLVEPR
jgi:hypothetical protein